MESKKENFLFFGELFNCTECGELKGIIEDKEHTEEEYKQMLEKYEKEWNTKETGKNLLSQMLNDGTMICSKCEKRKNPDEEILLKTCEIVINSQRQMPAHFTSNGNRNKSFCVDFDQLTADDEYEMASATYNLIEYFIKDLKNSTQRTWLVKLGEDAMLGAYITTKLGKLYLASDIEPLLTDRNISGFRDKDNKLDVDETYALTGVRQYLNYCIHGGVERALTGSLTYPKDFV